MLVTLTSIISLTSIILAKAKLTDSTWQTQTHWLRAAWPASAYIASNNNEEYTKEFCSNKRTTLMSTHIVNSESDNSSLNTLINYNLDVQAAEDALSQHRRNPLEQQRRLDISWFQQRRLDISLVKGLISITVQVDPGGFNYFDMDCLAAKVSASTTDWLNTRPNYVLKTRTCSKPGCAQNQDVLKTRMCSKPGCAQNQDMLKSMMCSAGSNGWAGLGGTLLPAKLPTLREMYCAHFILKT